MKKKIIVFFLLLIILINSAKNNKKKDQEIINNTKEEEIVEKKENIITVSVNKNNNKLNLDLEEYIIGVVACEMPASFDEEALKAMAVASRTYALYKLTKNKNYTLSSTTKDQCYITKKEMKKKWGKTYEKYYNKIKNIVYETSNEYLTYNNEIVLALYFSISNGKTENCENVFVKKLDYLVSVDSHWDKDYSYQKETHKYTVKDFLDKLNIKESKINNIQITKYNSGRVKNITINNKKYKGTKIQSLLSLKSSDIDIYQKNGYVYVKTKGYGHGVGMSQYGANSMAKDGYTYDEILKHYYTGVEIMNNL